MESIFDTDELSRESFALLQWFFAGKVNAADDGRTGFGNSLILVIPFMHVVDHFRV